MMERLGLKKSHFIIAFVSVIFIWAVGNIVSILNFKILFTHADWKLTQFHVNYIDHGFIRRGFIGTLFYPLFSQIINNIDLQKIIIFWKETFLYFLYASGIIIFFIRKTENLTLKARLFFISSFILSPCGLVEAAYDFGRYDHFNFILFAFSIYLIYLNKVTINSILLVFAALIHEGSIFYLHPLIFGLNYSRQNSRFFKALKVILPSIIIVIFIFLLGDKPIDLPPSVSVGNFWGEGIPYSYITNLDQKPKDIIIFVMYLIFSLTLILGFYISNRIKLDFLFLSCISPMVLFFIASDWGRWLHYIAINVFIVLAIKIYNLKDAEIPNYMLVILFLFGFPLGPIGIGGSLPYIETILTKF